MRWRCLAAWLVVVSVVSVGYAEPSRADPPATCGLQRIVSIPYQASPSGVVLVPANLNGHDTHLVLDTGAYWSVVTQSISSGLPHLDAPSAIIGSGGVDDTTYVTIRTINIGGLPLNHADFYVEPDAMAAESEIGGNLAANLLASADLEIDPAGGKINLYSHDHCPGRVVYWPHSDLATTTLSMSTHGLMTIPVNLDGQTLWALIDTGASYSTVESQVAEQKFGLKPGDDGMTPSGAATSIEGVQIPVSSHRFKFLSLDGIAFRNPLMLVGVDRSSHLASVRRGAREDGGRIPDMLLGMHELRLAHLYFAYKEKMLYATSLAGDAAAAKASPAAPG